MKICGYCGSQLDDAAVACKFCGRVIASEDELAAAKKQSGVLNEQGKPLAPDAAEAQGETAMQGTVAPQHTAATQGPGWQQAQNASQSQGVQPDAQAAQPGAPQNTWSNQQPAGAWQNPNAQQNNQQSAWNSQQQNNQQTTWNNQQPNNGAWQNQGNWGQADPWNNRGMQPQGKINGLGLASFILSIAGLFLGFLYCVPCILAIIFGIVALVQHSKNPGVYRYYGFAIAGIVIGAIGLLFWGAALIFSIRMVNYYAQNGGNLNDLQGIMEYIEQYFNTGFFVR